VSSLTRGRAVDYINIPTGAARGKEKSAGSLYGVTNFPLILPYIEAELLDRGRVHCYREGVNDEHAVQLASGASTALKRQEWLRIALLERRRVLMAAKLARAVDRISRLTTTTTTTTTIRKFLKPVLQPTAPSPISRRTRVTALQPARLGLALRFHTSAS